MSVKKRVLVVDDEQDVVLYLRAALSNAGLEVQSAGDADGAVAQLVESRPDLICLDLLMPGRTGLSLYRELRSHPHWREIPVLIVSGLGMEKEIAPRLKGVKPPEGYLEKPIELDSFLETVGRLVHQGERH